ncbi:ABC transporter ATP-binding protein [Pelagibacterium luteolum]|uniref:Phospholipid/cholesterol/gamma-HCH transport system ATP-binding protein n=1 Tax=Pelagibacterium luteolum TaxID=440168 RepID=A0A1G7VWA3_9HYPH|nr:ABC transporter ATP-binding protein [Pelagibacterium luteolum]SDG64094.1 phospholipid/cholesterol/gamma-HCH transport system ATP-binding protein [Pelagibacterium luteolum]
MIDATTPDPIISIRDLVVGFDGRNVIDGFSLDVRRGEVLGVIGPSGSGKSVTLRTVIGLLPKRSGTIEVLGREYSALPRKQRVEIERRWGVLFQQGALFSALTVLENVEFPLREHLDMPRKLRRDIARFKIDLVGLPVGAENLYPSELSGGMIKRAALARALSLDPDIVFLDEPTAGLDPIGAARFDELVLSLKDALGLTVYMVTHDLDSLVTVCDRIAALGSGKLLEVGTLAELMNSDDPWLQDYFHGPRARHLEKS